MTSSEPLQTPQELIVVDGDSALDFIRRLSGSEDTPKSEDTSFRGYYGGKPDSSSEMVYIILRMWDSASALGDEEYPARALETTLSEEEVYTLMVRYTMKDETAWSSVKDGFLFNNDVKLDGMTEAEVVLAVQNDEESTFADLSPYTYINTPKGQLFDFSDVFYQTPWHSMNLYRTCVAVMNGVATSDLWGGPTPVLKKEKKGSRKPILKSLPVETGVPKFAQPDARLFMLLTSSSWSNAMDHLGATDGDVDRAIEMYRRDDPKDWGA